MASIYDLKPKFQALLRPLCDRLATAGVTANIVTLAAMLLCVSAGLGLFLCQSRLALLILPVVLFVRMALNAIDGMLAREHGQKTALGALLNELGDVVSDAALYLPLAIVLVPFDASPWLIVFFVLAAVLTEFTGVSATLIGAQRGYAGPMGKSDRAAAIGIVATIIAFGAPGGWWLDLAFSILSMLAAITVVNRMRQALDQVSHG